MMTFLFFLLTCVLTGGSYYTGASGDARGLVIAGVCAGAMGILYSAMRSLKGFGPVKGVTFDEPLTVATLCDYLNALPDSADDRVVYLGGDRLYQARSMFFARLSGHDAIVIEKVDEYEDHTHGKN